MFAISRWVCGSNRRVVEEQTGLKAKQWPGSSGKEDQSVTHSFSNGDDVIEVCEGELINLQGKIVSIHGNMIVVMPKHEELKEALEFQASELRKYFTQGDHVKVVARRYTKVIQV